MKEIFEKIKEVRDTTCRSLIFIKDLLQDHGYNVDKTIEFITKYNSKENSNVVDNKLKQGIIFTYNHNGKFSTMIELRCETDFVAKTDIFKELGKEICFQVVGTQTEDIKKILNDPYVKDFDKTINELINDVSNKVKEKIELKRVVLWKV